MKKSYLMLAAAAALFAACSSNDLAEEKSPQTTQPTVDEQAVTFDAYTSRGTTRAGGLTALGSTDALKALGTAGGFGVFAYYTDGEPYSGITKPNFMYNQLVDWNSTKWEYTPIKYWPNEFGNDAISDQVDRLTLFAYAPWVDVTPITGLVKNEPNTNIIGMTRNTATGDPFIKYVATMDATNTTDLCYGVAAQNFTSSNSAINKNDIKKGEPYIDVKKPGIDENSKIYFDFKHATAQLSVTIDAVVNAASGTTNVLDKNNTRIWVRSVTFEGITLKGALNLNSHNATPEWYDMNGSNKITTGSVTVFDGRKDGKEALYEATNETPATLNSVLVQNAPYASTFSSTTPAGVTETAVNLFTSSTLTDPVYVIPTNEPMKVTIVYDVETKDTQLAYFLSDGSTPGSTIENTITKTITSFGNIMAGYHYDLKLHLGMRSVDFDAEVTTWKDLDAEADLPSNLQSYQVPATYYPTLPAAAGTYSFAMVGLTPSETVNGGAGDVDTDGVLGTKSYNAANSSGIAKQSVVINQNNTVSNKTATARWAGATSGKAIRLDFTQLAAPLGLEIQKHATYPDLVYIRTTASGTDWSSTSVNTLTIKKNGVVLTSGADYTFNKSTSASPIIGTIIFTPAPATDDVYEITVQAGDAPSETGKVNY